MINSNVYGKVDLDNDVFKDISLITINKTKGIHPIKDNPSFCAVAVKDGVLSLKLKVKIDTGVDVAKVCNKLTESVHESIESMTGIDCKKIDIDVQGFAATDNK